MTGSESVRSARSSGPIHRLAPAPADDGFRREAGVFASPGPGQRAEVEVPLVQVQNVNPVPDFGTPREGQNLVHRDVPEVQSPAQFRVRLDREEAKRAVEDPLDLGLLPAATDQRAAKRVMPAPRFDHLETGCPQRREVEIGGLGKAFDGVVKHVHVLGSARGSGILVQDRRPAT